MKKLMVMLLAAGALAIGSLSPATAHTKIQSRAKRPRRRGCRRQQSEPAAPAAMAQRR